ncbi:MAG: septum site-determining protein MinC [Caldicoprobacterales bacterium]|mgnify:CR=1 FL=1|jgi:septum site-determining protein MinC|nr:septum site-determining protein MinC [Clostridiales bacterium]
METQQPVIFKGTRNGLRIYIDQDSKWEEVLESAAEKLKNGKPFFEGSRVNLSFIGREFSSLEQKKILELFSEYMEPGSVAFMDKLPAEQEDQPSNHDSHIFDSIEEDMTRFVRGTVRSGQRIFYEGNIVVLGDVNPGGELIAGGNIVVIGTFRGVAHAGVSGNANAVVASYRLQPTQLRIADYIARAPEGETEKPDYPEIAFIKDGRLIIEPYLPKRVKA